MFKSVGATIGALGVSLGFVALSGPSWGQAGQAGPTHATAEVEPPPVDVTALAKASQNPVADMVSLPFQVNFNSGGAFEDETGMLINFQPVVPIRLGDKWTLIARGIVPLMDTSAGDERFRGLGDIQGQFYLTPKPKDFIWGAGLATSFPTATAAIARTGSWGIGPAGVFVKELGPWLVGGLANQLWSYADEGGDPELSLFTGQIFINYNIRSTGWAISTAPLITANWNAPNGQEWTVPIGGGISKTMVWGGQAMNLGLQYYYNAQRPDDAASSQLRFVVGLLYPKKS